MSTLYRKYLCNALTWLIAAVWIANGLFCKVLNMVPRHRLIVARILGEDYAGPLTRLIGLGEVLIAVWILSGLWFRPAAITQIVLVGVMNALEFLMTPDLLLFGHFNAVWALLFMGIIYFNEFIVHPQTARS